MKLRVRLLADWAVAFVYRYPPWRVASVGVLMALAILGFAAFDAPAWVWGILGLGVGVVIEDSFRFLGHRLHRFVRRPSEPVRRDEVVRFSGREWRSRFIDFPPGGMRFVDVQIEVVRDQLEVPDFVCEVERHLEDVLTQNPLPERIVFDNNAALVIASPPVLTRDEVNGREQPGARLRAATTSYFSKVLCRGNIPNTVLDHVRQFWDPQVLDPEDVRSHLLPLLPPEGTDPIDDGFHPLRHPNLGIAVAPIIEDGARLYTAWAKRSSSMATNAGRLGVPVNEAIVPTDQSRNSHRIDVANTFVRAFREEVGASREDPSFGIGGLLLDEDGGGTVDRNGIHSGGGFILVGWARISISPQEYVELLPRDRFEAEFVETCPLGIASLAGVIAASDPSAWFPPALLAYAAALEHTQVGGWRALSRFLEREWSRACS